MASSVVKSKKPVPTAAADDSLGTALDFLKRIWQLNHALERLSSRMEKRLGITAQQRLLIRTVGRHPGIGSGNLATLLSVDPGTVSASLKRLEAKGILERRGDPRDGRRVSLHLTPRGRHLDRPAHGTVEAAVERLLAEGNARDVRAFGRTLEQLTERLTDELEP